MVSYYKFQKNYSGYSGADKELNGDEEVNEEAS